MGVYPESFLAPMRSDVGSFCLPGSNAQQPEGDARLTHGVAPIVVAGPRGGDSDNRAGSALMIASIFLTVPFPEFDTPVQVRCFC